MDEQLDRILKQALELPPEARAALAGSLLDSLDEPVGPLVEDEWNKEIAIRLNELDSGKVKPIPWAEARKQISAILDVR
jgi:putative addiction module component (TIGR02574 family)